ncbi:jg25803 [Pararge aegeria aegeria]|uniref:Jg25803 protein n=1 Tax=Pararge aegeria aegeria TaxID=348720 RepID=A0A8S4RXX0_9NEOP|nr:jg25803 [Pararge aegeria aegeria]
MFGRPTNFSNRPERLAFRTHRRDRPRNTSLRASTAFSGATEETRPLVQTIPYVARIRSIRTEDLPVTR